MTNFTKILRKSQSENALIYLTDKQGTKGKDIKYSRIEMSEYLLPSTSSLTIEEKQEMFSMKNKVIKIPANFPKNKKIQSKCSCGELENMEHVYKCELFNDGNNDEEKLEYGKIYSGNISEQIKVFRNMKECVEKRSEFENMKSDNKEEELPCDPSLIHYYNSTIG